MADLSTIENIIAGLTPAQVKRLDAIHRQVEVELARGYGDRLAPIMTEVLVRESTVHPDVLAAIEGIEGRLPASAPEWRGFVRTLVEKNEMAERNLAFSDEKLRAEFAADELSRLRPDQRISLSRAGKLDAYLDDRVQQRLEEPA